MVRRGKRGRWHWLLQRSSAMIMAVCTVLLLIVLLIQPPDGYASWITLMGHGWIRLTLLLFLFSLIVHAWIGIKDVLNDYIKPKTLCLWLQRLVELILCGYTLWAVNILWNV